ncbi:MAG: DUF1415 domain-containing protein [Bacteroidetes bacterium]|nr:DUF1415 domain-containing protein [Bacteroidota bacterium]
MTTPTLSEDHILQQTRTWVESFVIGYGLCPFAKHELVHDRIRFVVSRATSGLELASALEDELKRLARDETIGTTLLIHPGALTDFQAYLVFLDIGNGLLEELGLDGDIQIASFHPTYQFAGTRPEDASNYTNRSPYPMLHLIREEDVSRAVETHPDVSGIPSRNIALMQEIGVDKLKALTSGG